MVNTFSGTKGLGAGSIRPSSLSKNPKIIVHEADQPDLVVDLSDAHHLASEHGADVDFASAKADATAARDPNGSIMIRVLELGWWLVDAR